MTAAEGRAIIPGFHPDPSLCRFGDRFLLVTSSFEYAPALPLWSSPDLVNWTLEGNVLDRPEQLRLDRFRRWIDGSPISPETDGLPPGSANTGAFAPTIRAHAGRLHVAVTNVSDFFGGPMVVTADHPSGPWSDGVQFPELPGIDPDLFWDAEGTAHLTVSSYADGAPCVRSAPVDLTTGRLLGPARRLWSGTGGQAPESPHLIRRGDWIYLLLAEGGTERGHAVTIARTRDLASDDWEAAPGNPLLTHRGLDRPVLNVGHADLVELADDRWAMVYLGVRPRGFSGFHVNGRETFLAGVTWVDGWPVVDEGAFPVPARDHTFVERFDGTTLHARWVSPGRLPAQISRAARPGRWIGATDDAGEHALLACRPLDDFWRAEIELADVEGLAGLCLRVDERHAAEVLVDGDGRVVSRITVGDLRRERPAPELASPPRLYIEVSPDGAPVLLAGPDVVEVGVVVEGRRIPLDRVDGRYLSVEVAGGWTGRVVGIRCAQGRARITEFHYSPSDRDPVLLPHRDSV
ncbi:glycoside hydrolase family 43 protein [Schumannella luteola]|nr:glycoside hydrolase family 43 protein [Schumannella luteola]